MSGIWTYVGTATRIDDWQDQGPWHTNVGDLLSQGGAEIEFKVLDDDQLSVLIEPLDGTEPQEGTATYQPDGSVVGYFENDGSSYLLVASLAQVAQVTDRSNTEWHMYALAMEGDPDNVAVIGAQGGGAP